jgi:glucose-6-phosphate 1-dehydrogenase
MIVIFGATGDLTRRKLIPAIYNLFKKGNFADSLICISRKEFSTEDFIESLQLSENIGSDEIDPEFVSSLKYYTTDFRKPDIRFLQTVLSKEKETIFYLAVGPELFHSLIDIIKQLGINRKKVVFEKPFGFDLESATELNDCISKTFNEKEIYRIDHYLGKEMVQNILVFRFANSIFEQIWNHDFIEKVEIIISETAGIGRRAEYYENAGALRDMMQNHLLQLLALTAMNPPISMQADDIRDEVVKVLRKVKPLNIKVAQYESYRQEIEKPDSVTETYAALTLNIDEAKWQGVPFELKTGKKLAQRYAEINLLMKDVSCRLFSRERKIKNLPNTITLRIQPNEGIMVKFNAKIPGAGMDLQQVKMDFCHKCEFGPNTPEAYESLLFEILEGDQTLFTRWDSVEASWKIIDQIRQQKKQLSFYQEGSEVF